MNPTPRTRSRLCARPTTVGRGALSRLSVTLTVALLLTLAPVTGISVLTDPTSGTAAAAEPGSKRKTNFKRPKDIYLKGVKCTPIAEGEYRVTWKWRAKRGRYVDGGPIYANRPINKDRDYVYFNQAKTFRFTETYYSTDPSQGTARLNQAIAPMGQETSGSAYIQIKIDIPNTPVDCPS